MDGKGGRKRHALILAAVLLALGAEALGQYHAALAVVILGSMLLFAADQAAGRKGLFIAQIAAVYVAVPALSLLYVMRTGHALAVFWLLAVVWATDIGAYAFGRIIGGPKLAPRVSPNKTWSGAVGGLISAALASSGLLLWGYGLGITAILVVSAVLLSVVSQAGDLFESGLKRHYGVKDSGALIPGHGGVMDRFDGLWAAAPLAALFCLVMNGGPQTW